MKLDHKILIFWIIVLPSILASSFLLTYWYRTLEIQRFWAQRQAWLYIALFLFAVLLCSSLLYLWRSAKVNKKNLNNLSDWVLVGIVTVLTTTSLKAMWMILETIFQAS